MFIPLKYGIARAAIGTGEFLVKCPSCETDQWAQILVSSVYSHFYFIPLYPYDKDAYVCCEKCGLKRYAVPFDDKLIINYKEIKGKYKHPWYTYIGVGILASPFFFYLMYFLYTLF
jgi:hypothetical protein